MATHPTANHLNRWFEQFCPEFLRAHDELKRRLVDPANAQATADNLLQKTVGQLKEALRPLGKPLLMGDTFEHATGWVLGLSSRRNLTHGRAPLSFYAVLLEQGQAQFGAIFLPVERQMAWAAANYGAFSDVRLRLNNRPHATDGILQLPWRTADILELDLMPFSFKHQLHTRKSGDPIADIVSFCAGQADVFISGGLTPAEIELTALFVKESGGFITDMAGQPPAHDSKHLLCANAKIHVQLLKILSIQ